MAVTADNFAFPKKAFASTNLNLHKERIQNLYRLLFMMMTGLLILPVAIIMGMLIYKGSPAISVEFLFTNPTQGMTAGGIFPALFGTIWLVAVALLFSVPLGIAAAIYLSEYAPNNWLTRLINLCIINLAGFPSIVHALHVFGAFMLFAGMGTSILATSLTLAIMTMPVVIVATKVSLQAVPQSFREATWNLEATRWQTIVKVVVPNAISGILTDVIFIPFLPQGLFDQTMALSLHLFVVLTQVPGMPESTPYGVALVLIS